MGFDCVFGIVQGKRQAEPRETAKQRVSVVPVYVCWCVKLGIVCFFCRKNKKLTKAKLVLA